MIRTIATLTALAFGLSAVSAEELKGTLKKVNKAGNTLTLTIDGKDKTLPVSKDASFVSVTTVPAKKKKSQPTEQVTPIDGGLGGLKEGSAVTVLTEKAEEKETVTSVKVGGGTAAKKKKAKKVKPVAEILQPISTSTGEELIAAKGAKADKAKGKKAKKAAKKAKKAKKPKKAKKAKKSD